MSKNEIICWNCNKDSGHKSSDLKLSDIDKKDLYCANCNCLLIKAKK